MLDFLHHLQHQAESHDISNMQRPPHHDFSVPLNEHSAPISTLGYKFRKVVDRPNRVGRAEGIQKRGSASGCIRCGQLLVFNCLRQ